EDLASSPYGPTGARRAFRMPIHEPQVSGGADEHGPYVFLAFELPRGSFATVVLRELMKSATPEDASPESDSTG
ncbi:MAG: tRNA pseudouridine(13) synthase TruD, partial [Phycisphaeraceae bacterium]